MSNYFTNFVSFIVAVVVMLTACAPDHTQATFSNDKLAIQAYNLLEPLAAAKLLSDKSRKYLPIQVSKREAFLKEHLPSAQNIWRPDYGSDISVPYGGLIPTKEKLQNLLQELGVQKGDTLLLYDAKANVDAFRFAWVLNLYGFDAFKIINGGLKYWKLNGQPLTTELAPPRPLSDYQLSDTFRSSSLAGFEEVLAAVSDSNTIIIDTRESYEYEGRPFVSKGKQLDYKKGAFDRGSIPSATHLNWSTLADLNGDHRIKAEKDLRYDLEKRGITADKEIVLYCQSGSRTCHTYYVLKHVLGFDKVKNYDGSWIEYSYKSSQDSSVSINQICPPSRFKEIKDSLKAILMVSK